MSELSQFYSDCPRVPIIGYWAEVDEECVTLETPQEMSKHLYELGFPTGEYIIHCTEAPLVRNMYRWEDINGYDELVYKWEWVSMPDSE